MRRSTRRELEGMNELVVDAVHAAAAEVEHAHAAIARYPYAILARVTPLRVPVGAVEFVERTITGAVYRTIHVAADVVGAAVATAIAARARRHDDQE
jgi:hypothetical protein